MKETFYLGQNPEDCKLADAPTPPNSRPNSLRATVAAAVFASAALVLGCNKEPDDFGQGETPADCQDNLFAIEQENDAVMRLCITNPYWCSPVPPNIGPTTFRSCTLPTDANGVPIGNRLKIDFDFTLYTEYEGGVAFFPSMDPTIVVQDETLGFNVGGAYPPMIEDYLSSNVGPLKAEGYGIVDVRPDELEIIRNAAYQPKILMNYEVDTGEFKGEKTIVFGNTMVVDLPPLSY